MKTCTISRRPREPRCAGSKKNLSRSGLRRGKEGWESASNFKADYFLHEGKLGFEEYLIVPRFVHVQKATNRTLVEGFEFSCLGLFGPRTTGIRIWSASPGVSQIPCQRLFGLWQGRPFVTVSIPNLYGQNSYTQMRF